MAHTVSPLDRDQFCCPICLDMLKEPVAIPCGHSYCMGCISSYWGADDPSKTSSCPQCRQTFSPRPILKRNTILAEMVEKLSRMEVQESLPHSSVGPGDVGCDLCPAGASRAARSCLVCLASYCEAHLRSHQESPALRKHALVEASMQLQQRVCPHHDKLLEIYCRTDRQCVCVLCVVEEHRGHDAVPAAAERAEKQRQLGRSRRSSRQRVQAKEKELAELRRILESLKRSAQAAVEDSERIFTELLQSIERRRGEVRELIRGQEETAVSQTQQLMDKLEQELVQLKKRDAELEKLANTDDHIYFLQNCQSVSQKAELTESLSVTVVPLLDFGTVQSSVSALQKRLEDLFKRELPKISRAANTVKLLQSPEPRARPEFLYYSLQLSVDSRTAHRDLSVSQESRTVTVRTRDHSGPDHPDRFDYWCQVLCRQALSGRCYWEAEWSGGGVNIAVACKSMARKGDGNDAHFGHNDKSWSLFCSRKGCTFWHGNVATRIASPAAGKIGVYLDHKAGSLSFYCVSDTMTLLHRVQARFTEPVYPGFEFMCFGVSVTLCQVE
ncbi:tripartite motif-containing protein 16 [Centroberyx affinis]|uniref:tripartite motif-containing protein 16 n=1 Tax=Centroberyx affinis TaxID=166261 RepID=UPI003A5BA2BB